MWRCRSFWILVLLPTLSACDSWAGLFDQGGEQVEGPFELSLLATETCPLPAGLDPARVAIRSYRVRIRSALDSGVPANYFYASLLTSDGSRYLADFPGCAPLLSGAPAYAGEEAIGYLNFPVPPDKTPETIVYAPRLEGLQREASVRELALRENEPPRIEEEL